MGAASPRVTQNPERHCVAGPQAQQSLLMTQVKRQVPPTQDCPVAQSVLTRQLACGRVSGRHTPARHRSKGPQSLSAAQAGLQ